MSPFLSDPLPPWPDPTSEGAEARHPAAVRRSVRAFRSKGFAEQRDSCKKEEVPGSCCVRRSARAACPCCFFFLSTLVLCFAWWRLSPQRDAENGQGFCFCFFLCADEKIKLVCL